MTSPQFRLCYRFIKRWKSILRQSWLPGSIHSRYSMLPDRASKSLESTLPLQNCTITISLALVCHAVLSITILYQIFVVLHPCLRSHWFTTTADPHNASAQEEAIQTVEDIFKYIAETCLEAQTPPAPTAIPRPVANPVVKTPSFLASACAFKWPNTAATTVLIPKRTPHEELAIELTRYFNFEAAPIDRDGGEAEGSNEPSLQDILLNPLLWWKVNTYLIYVLSFWCSVSRYMLPNFPFLLGWLGTSLPFLQRASLLNGSSQSLNTFVAVYAALWRKRLLLWPYWRRFGYGVGSSKWCRRRYCDESMVTMELKSSHILIIYKPFIIHIYIVIPFRQPYMYNCPWAIIYILNGWSLNVFTGHHARPNF